MKNNMSENDRVLLAEKLKEMRLAHGYKQDDIAGAIDIKQGTYSNYENAKRIPGPVTLYRIANFYGLKTDELLKLVFPLDEDVYYDAPAPGLAVQEEEDFLAFREKKSKRKLSRREAQLLFYFSKLSPSQQDELINYTEFKSNRKK